MNEAKLAGSGSDRQPGDIRPVVATGNNGNWTLWAFLVVLAIAGAWLFNALSSAREAADTSSTLAQSGPTNGRIASPDPLRIPERFADMQPLAEPAVIEPRQPVQARVQPPAPVLPALLPTFQPVPRVQPVTPAPALPQVVFENRAPRPPAPSSAATSDLERVTASRLSNPSQTIPKGTVIPAVLETALDSTRPGGARALVQRDMYGFDGTRVLIPRGSRLYGEYETGIDRGQNRALVQWTRLMRPDGATIALDSPSSDPLGRAGIKGKVDGKFWQRFGGALLNSILDVGVGLAVNEASDGVIVALPGSTQNVQVADTESIRPTLKVKHGTSVSVFVARDLDFSSVDP
ncbi:TrbI/VirB10 family protein [Erythrobacter sp. MTPC3]|uniref:TrbI/VirB10 family protein n=1 Tax=Erythrobacter sp. MTPC3 TaxID=3056564 RepID=UPI0036F319CB